MNEALGKVIILGCFLIFSDCKGQKIQNKNPMAEENKTEKSFTILTEKPEQELTVSDIEIRCAFSKVQPLSQGGIAFNLYVTNNTDMDKTIFNPLDFFSIALQNEEGWPLQLPFSGPNRHMVNSLTPVEIVRPYKITSFSNSRNEPGLLAMVNEEIILLKANTTYSYDILIDKVMKFDKNNPTERTTETQPLTKEKYKINMRMSIMLSEKSEIHNTWESGYSDIELQ